MPQPRTGAAANEDAAVTPSEKEQKMTPKLKALGIAFVAVFAMSAMAVSAAQAEGVSELTPQENKHAIITGEQVGRHIFKTSAGQEITCEIAKFDGTINGNSTTATVAPTYSECHTTFPKLPATVAPNGCDYLFHGQLTNPANTFKASVDVVCPSPGGVESTFEVGIYNNAGHTELLCTLTIRGQTGKTTNTITNVAGTPDDVKVVSNVTGIETTSHQALCGQKTVWQNSTYTGETTVKAYATTGTPEVENGQVNLTVSHL
jgi:hypothetical protein